MSRIGNLEQLDDNSSTKKEIKNDVAKPSPEDKRKLDTKGSIKKPADMTDKEKIEYYRSKGLNDLANNREAIQKYHEGKGLSHRPSKMNSHNYDKLMQERGVNPEKAKETKESFSKWSPENNDKSKDSSDEVTVRHARPGEKVNVMHSKGKPASGEYVTKDKIEKMTPEERIRDFSLPSVNKADSYNPAYLKKQDVIEGKAAPQKKFEGNDNIPRTGGGKQIVTDGGYRKNPYKDGTANNNGKNPYIDGAVKNINTMNTPSERKIIRELDESGESPAIRYNKDAPKDVNFRRPKESGQFDGNRFYPNDKNAQEKMKEYGKEYVEYKNDQPDFSPFVKHNIGGKEHDTTVQIGHMSGNRENPKYEYGRRKIGESHDPKKDLGNYAQADNALCEKINKANGNHDLTGKDIEKYRKANNLTWHECADGKTMQLVPTEIHNSCPHTAGTAISKNLQKYGNAEFET